MLITQAAARTPKSRPAKHMFGGKTKCHCGTVMYFKKQLGKYDCPSCHNKIRGDDLEAIFVEQLQSFLLSEKEIGEYLLSAKETAANKKLELDAAIVQRDKLQVRTDNLLGLHLNGSLDKDVFLRRYKPLEKQLTQIEDSIPALQARYDVEQIALTSSDQVLEDARSVYSRWDILDTEDKRKIVETVVEHIIVDKDEIDISLNYLPHPPSLSKRDGKATNSHGFIAAIS